MASQMNLPEKLRIGREFVFFVKKTQFQIYKNYKTAL